jgi:hypothetical protein
VRSLSLVPPFLYPAGCTARAQGWRWNAWRAALGNGVLVSLDSITYGRGHGVDGFLWRYSYVRAWLAAHGRELGRDPARHACSRGCEITVIQQPCCFRLGLLSHRSARLRSTTHATTPVSGRIVDLAPILCSPSSPAAACTTDDDGRPGRSRYCIPCIGHPGVKSETSDCRLATTKETWPSKYSLSCLLEAIGNLRIPSKYRQSPLEIG